MACSNSEIPTIQQTSKDAYTRAAATDGGESANGTHVEAQAQAPGGKHISFAPSVAPETNLRLPEGPAPPTEKPCRTGTEEASAKAFANVDGGRGSHWKTSPGNKRDSGLSVEGNSNTHTFGPCPSPAFKRGPPSIAGGASIGGVSAAPSILTAEEELISRRVRSLYNDSGSDIQSSYSRRGGAGGDSDGALPGGRKRQSRGLRSSLVVTDEEGGLEEAFPEAGSGVPIKEEEGDITKLNGNEGRQSADEAPRASIELVEDERDMLLAGGIEDWHDVDGRDIDRYGFIHKPGHQRRVSTSLFAQSNIPKKKRRNHHLKLLVNPFDNEPAHEMLQSPLKQQKDESKEKEVQRAKKWRAMAVSMTASKTSRWRRKAADNHAEGAGVSWKFITTDSKLISRTWKGIPDCWRSAAWHAFLTASAEKRDDCLSDEELKAMYQDLVERGCTDDVQIDLDVPRTINSHIMFRRRYRGGQRLLFRVLHCLSLYFSSIGYVQGMASIAATLLCYYDEETTFIMLVRMWELRGLAKLYQSGFGGLMEALDEFEQKWLDGGLIGQKLESLGIGPTAYGTKWYLTLFNYSIPFQAQLRVWDVFMLLGDPDPPVPSPNNNNSCNSNNNNSSTNSSKNNTLKSRRKKEVSTEKQNSHHGFQGLHFSGLKSSAASTRSGKTTGIGFSFSRPKTANHACGNAIATANSTSSTLQRPPTPPHNQGFNGALDVLHATSAALIDGMKDILMKSDFENGMKVLTSWIPVKDEELLMRVVKHEWKGRKRKGMFVGAGGGSFGGGAKGGAEGVGYRSGEE